MKFGIFYELQLPRPWQSGDENRLFQDALDQIEIADKLGFDYVWEVEHHFLEEYSHSSAPEVFLGAVSQRTKNIRLGHGIVQLPFQFNHPVRVAERIATLDLISNGRVDFGTGESSSEVELQGFNVNREHKRDEWRESLDAITKMMVESPFSGYNGNFFSMPPRNIVPKSVQKPHPPLWVACSRRETIHLAATLGIGALSFSFIEPEEAKAWVDDYYETIKSENCVPAGFSVNAQVACVIPLMCHKDEETAIERGLDGGHFFGYSLAHYYVFGDHTPGKTNISEEFEKNRALFGFSRQVAATKGEVLGAQIINDGTKALRGAIGTPDQILDLVSRYEAVGVDQLIFVSQCGRNKSEHIIESLQLFASEVMPSFKERQLQIDQKKESELEPFVASALKRREPARKSDLNFSIPASMKI